MVASARLIGIIIASACLLVVGCSDQELDSMREVGGKALSKAQRLTDEVAEKMRLSLPPGRRHVAAQRELVHRVEGRLRYDKALEGAEVRVEPGNDGLVLSGHVRSETQRRRALELAESTAGVVRVIDNLSLVPGKAG